MVYKKVRWFSDALRISKGTVKNIFEYLEIAPNANGEFPIDSLPKVKQFYDTHNCATLFNKITTEKNKQAIINELHSNPDIVVLKDIVDYNDKIKRCRLAATLNNRNIKTYKNGNIAYISKDDYERLKDSFDDLNNGITHTGSHPEQEIFNYVQSIYDGEVLTHVRNVIPPQELDIYIPGAQVAIEFNGQYYHSDIAGTDKYYHLNKSIKCANKGIHLIHIYEWE